MHTEGLLTCWTAVVQVSKAAIQRDAHHCNRPQRAEDIDQSMHEVRLRVVQQACLIRQLHQPWAKQEQDCQHPLGAQPTCCNLLWLSADITCIQQRRPLMHNYPMSWTQPKARMHRDTTLECKYSAASSFPATPAPGTANAVQQDSPDLRQS